MSESKNDSNKSEIPNEEKMISEATSENQSNSETSQPFLEFEKFSNFFETFSTSIKETVASSTKVPLKQSDLDFYLTLPSFKNFMNSQNDRLLKLMGSLLKDQNFKKSNNIYSKKLDDDERVDLLIDANDQTIEKLGIQLDELQGLRKKTETELKLSATSLNVTSRNINTSWNKDVGMVVNKSLLQNLQSNNPNQSQNSFNRFNANDIRKGGAILKSQLTFTDKIDNSRVPFIPKIRNKPNAIVPLPQIFTKLDNSSIDEFLFEENPELLCNPYTHEIEQFKPELDLNAEIEAKAPSSLEETYFKYIDKVDDLKWLCEHLKNREEIKEIAVDLEHHSYRSFLGFTCLMQISTRQKDFIIDTIKLRSEMHRLNEIFTDPKLLKVLHGAEFDIEWLQKDFGIYVVNMFDTGQATRILQYPYHSLSYLLQKYCSVIAQKQYQLADWRQRPLSDEMLKYAREDTHYLLYIYDNLKKELLKHQSNSNESSQLMNVYEKSKIICKKVYKKPLFYSKGFLNLCQHNPHLNSKQLKALKDLYEWRDRVARESDESCEYVLKSHQLLKISELLPREIYGILALCNPLSSLVESNVHEMHEIITKAREFRGVENSLGLDSTENETKLNETNQSRILETLTHLNKYDPDDIINCPHDISHISKLTHEDSMETQESTDKNAIEAALKSNLNELLIKPSNNFNKISLPNNLILEPSSELNRLFTKKQNFGLIKNKNQHLKLIDKIEGIKSSIKNPFEMYLPNEFKFKDSTNELNGVDASKQVKKWKLIKPTSDESNNNLTLSATDKTNQNDIATKNLNENDSSVIPLRVRRKQELNPKKLKKKLQNIVLSEAIAEYNNSKNKLNALGSENLEEMANDSSQAIEIQEDMIQSVESNLKSISDSLKPKKSKEPKFIKPYTYDEEQIKNLFAKKTTQDKPKYDPTSKIKQSKFGKVNKRHLTNTVTRSKHNQSITFKPASSK